MTRQSGLEYMRKLWATPRVRLALKLAATVAVLGVFLKVVPLEAGVATLRKADPLLCILAAAVFLGRNVFAAYRWRVLLAARGYRMGLGRLTRLYLESNFYGMVLPSGVGGDMYRGACIGREASLPVAMSSIVLERFLGCVALLGICLLSGMFGESNALVRDGAVSFAALALGGAAVLFFSQGLATRLVALPMLGMVPRLFLRVRAELAEYARAGVLIRALGASFVFQFFGVATAWLCGAALGDGAGLATYAYVLPMVWVVSLVPVTISGLGIREGALVLLLLGSGVPPQVATAVSILWLLVRYGANLIGGLAALALQGGRP